jgi:hypothetical protein
MFAKYRANPRLSVGIFDELGHSGGMVTLKMNNGVKFFFAVLVFFLLARSSPIPPDPLRPRAFPVLARPIRIDSRQLEIPSALSLRLDRAWELNAGIEEFGGVSALHASGNTLVLLSDRGAIIRLLVDPRARRWQADISALPPGCSSTNRSQGADTESLAGDPASGTLWIGMEIRNAICRIRGVDAGQQSLYSPPAMKGWTATGGPEAMVRLEDGRFLVFEERPLSLGGRAPESALLLFDRDPVDPAAQVTRMHYRPPAGFRPVDAAMLPDGRMLVINRRFSLPFTFAARLTIVDPRGLKAGASLTGPVIARFDGDQLGENFEAIAIDNDGRNLIIWLASDNNFLDVQRTLLLRFVWPLTVKR